MEINPNSVNAYLPKGFRTPGTSLDKPVSIKQLNEDLAAIGEGINDIAGSARPGSFSTPFSVQDVVSGIERWSFTDVRLEPGESVDVNVDITQSAQHGGLYFDLGSNQLDLVNNSSSFTLDVTGSLGSQALSFASGTSINDIAASINAFSESTGVTAAVSGTGIVLATNGFGSNEFVSVELGGNHLGTDAAIRNLQPDNFNQAGETLATGQDLYGQSFHDAGQDIDGLINGIDAEGEGTLLRFNTPDFSGAISIGTDNNDRLNAFELGSALALRLTRPAGRDGSGDNPQIDVEG